MALWYTLIDVICGQRKKIETKKQKHEKTKKRRIMRGYSIRANLKQKKKHFV
jgi:hypothetical protein